MISHQEMGLGNYDPQAQHTAFADFTSHRRVRAAKIKVIYSDACVGIEGGYSVAFDPAGKPTPQAGWYVIAYDDGYLSFCPPEQFEKGYTAPVASYSAQSDEHVAIVNDNKHMEEILLRAIDELGVRGDIDPRWLAIGRSHIELGFMAVNRSIFKPKRISLPRDAG